MISNYNMDTGEYETPRPKSQPTPGGEQTNTPDTAGGGSAENVANRWSDYLASMLGDAQNKQYRGGGFKPKFSQQYQDYTNNMYGRVEDYMNDPRGYSDEELAMMRGKGMDAITASGGGYRQMMEDAQKNQGYYGGSLGNLEGVGRQTSRNIADLQRNIALSDMDIRRQQGQNAMQVGMGWGSQMSGDERFMIGQRGAAASRGAGAYNKNLDYIRGLQRDIGQMDIQEGMYRTGIDWQNRQADMQYPQYPTGGNSNPQDPRNAGYGTRYPANY